jgi:tudor domain-containing protein 1/4/6/7
VESVNGDKIKVFHREYGNSEVLHKSKLRELKPEFADVKDLVVPAYFAIKPTGSDVKSLFNEMMKVFEGGSKEFNFKICARFKDGWILEPIDPATGSNVIEELVKAKKVMRVSDSELAKILDDNEKLKDVKKERKSPEKPKRNVEVKKEEKKEEVKKEPKELKAPPKPESKKQEEKPKKAPEKPIKNPSRIPVKLTAMTSPTDFYISRSDDASKFAKLHADIQIIATGAALLENFEESTLCLALQPFDNHWYRAKVIDSDDDGQMITVRCLDDGKTFSVDDKKLLKIMPAALEQRKFFGIPCSLLVKVERKCEESATELMMQLMENELQMEFVCRGDKNFVELFKGEENIADTLLEGKLASRLEVLPSGKGYTSHINSTSSFYLQFESDQLKLDVIAQYFEEAQGEFEAVENGKPGDIVAALFPEDDCWYRTRIEEVEGDQFSVMFLDYGNSCRVEKIGKISEPAIVELPKMSKHCTLAKPPGIKRFSDAAEKKFEEICNSGASILDVKMSKPGDPIEVELILDGMSVVDELVRLCEPIDGVLDKSLNDSGAENLMSN